MSVQQTAWNVPPSTADRPRPAGAAARRDARRGALTRVVFAPVRAAVRAVRALRDRLVPENFGTVDEGRIYRSARLTARAVRRIHREFGVRTIIDLAAQSSADPRRRGELEAIRALGIRRVPFRLRGDGQGEPAAYAAALSVMADPGCGPVLVHCAAGANRTSTAAVLYLHVVRDVPLDAAFRTCIRHGCDFARRPEHRGYVERHLTTVRGLLARRPVQPCAVRNAADEPCRAGPGSSC